MEHADSDTLQNLTLWSKNFALSKRGDLSTWIQHTDSTELYKQIIF